MAESQENKRRMIQVRANNAILQHSLGVRIDDMTKRLRDEITRYEDEKRELCEELVKVKCRTKDVDSLLKRGLNDPVTKKLKQGIVSEIAKRQEVNHTKYQIARANLRREQYYRFPETRRAKVAPSDEATTAPLATVHFADAMTHHSSDV